MMDKYDKFKLLGNINKKYIIEANDYERPKRACCLQHFILPAAVTLMIMAVMMISHFGSPVERYKNQEIAAWKLNDNFAQKYNGGMVTDYGSISQVKLSYNDTSISNERIEIITEGMTVEKYCPGFFQAMRLLDRHGVKSISVIYISESMFVLDARKGNTDYFIPIYIEEDLPQEFLDISSMKQLPQTEDFLTAYMEYVNTNNDVYGKKMVLHIVH